MAIEATAAHDANGSGRSGSRLTPGATAGLPSSVLRGTGGHAAEPAKNSDFEGGYDTRSIQHTVRYTEIAPTGYATSGKTERGFCIRTPV